MTRYILTVLLALDQLINALTLGYADETVSRRLAISSAEGKWFGCLFCRVVDYLAPGHCDMTTPSKASKLSRGGTLLRR